MILADTSAWVKFFRNPRGVPQLGEQIASGRIWGHPFVEGELLLGGLPPGTRALMRELSMLEVIEHATVCEFAAAHRLAGSGMGWIDVHLLASTLAAGGQILTMDKALNKVARRLHCCAQA